MLWSPFSWTKFSLNKWFEKFRATCNTFNTINKFNDDRLVFYQWRVDVKTNGSIAFIYAFKTFSLFNMITALTLCIPFSLLLLLLYNFRFKLK